MSEQEFIAAMSASGVECRDSIIADGKIHRFSTDGKRHKKNGWYVFHGNAGAYGDWSLDISKKWRSNDSNLSAAEEENLKQQIEQAKKLAEKDQQEANERTAKEAKSIFKGLERATTPPYLERKKIKPFGIRSTGNESIVVPLYDINNKLWSLQYICSDGNKFFMEGGRKKGCFFTIGKLGNYGPIYICEGYSTAASIFETLKETVVVTFDAGNIAPVVSAIRNKYPDNQIIICADNDQWKEKNIGKIKAEEAALKYNCKIAIPEFNLEHHHKKPTDFNDLHVLCGLHEVRKQIESACNILSEEETKKPSQKNILLNFTDKVEFFHDSEKQSYATVNVDSHFEHYPIRSQGFKHWLTNKYYINTGSAPNSQTLQEVLAALEAKAIFSGKEHEVFLRVGEYEGDIYIDLGRKDWQFVKISPVGYEIVTTGDIKFIRSKTFGEIPLPQDGGKVDQLQELVNLKNIDEFRLVICWMLSALRPGKNPFPILIIQGEQGTGKTFLCEVIRSLIDPSSCPLRTMPRDEKDLIISAKNNLILAYDNLSGIRAEKSDALCRMSTGGGMASRRLYSDGEEYVLSAMRPQLINGIDSIASRPDLSERSIILNLDVIEKYERKDVTTLKEEFEQKKPFIVGAIFKALSVALKNIDSTILTEKPRMADFALWSTSIEDHIGWNKGGFIEVYLSNRENSVVSNVENHPLCLAVLKFSEEYNPGEEIFRGTATELLDKLKQYAPNEDALRSILWPKQASQLSKQMKRIAPDIRQFGVQYEAGNKVNGLSNVVLRKITFSTSTPSTYITKYTDNNNYNQGGEGRGSKDDEFKNGASRGKGGEIHNFSNGSEERQRVVI